MKDTKIKAPYTMGALVRRAWRRILFVRGLRYEEDKGLLDSVFLVEATREEHEELHQLVENYKNS